MILFYLALLLGAVHFIVPLAYYAYLRRHVDDPWGLDIDSDYEPKVTVILPTYNEASMIEKRLENIRSQNYASEKLKILVVDSASTDGTVEVAGNWMSENPELNVEIIKEPEKRGMVPALNYALEYVPEESEVLVFTDADCEWKFDSLKNGIKYFSDGSIGTVTCHIHPPKDLEEGLEDTYRNYSNVTSVGESKVWSTPVAHGPFLAIRHSLLKEIGGLPTWVGADDSPLASLTAFAGYRAIAAPAVVAREHVPGHLRDNISRRIRRAQHLIQNFLRTEKKARTMGLKPKKPFKRIFQMEKFIHVVNPWVLLSAAVLLAFSFFSTSLFALAVMGAVGIGVAISKRFRSWLLNQGILIYASVRNLFTETSEWKPIRR